MGDFPNKETQFKHGEVVQPTPEQKSAGWAKKRMLKDLLNLCLTGKDRASMEARRLLGEMLNLNEDEITKLTLEEAMDLRQIQKAITKADTPAWKAIKEVMYGTKTEITGQPLQVVIKVASAEVAKTIEGV